LLDESNAEVLCVAARPWLLAFMASVALLTAGCGGAARLSVADGMGTEPVLPPPRPSWLPVVKIAPAVGWRDGATPTAAEGLEVVPFATGLDHPRWLHVLPNGDVLVAETSAPQREDARRGIKGFFMARAMQKAGAAAPSADRITLLRDTDRDGVAELRSTLVAGLH
jgi:glucose/arabinose dehydrogenase